MKKTLLYLIKSNPFFFKDLKEKRKKCSFLLRKIWFSIFCLVCHTSFHWYVKTSFKSQSFKNLKSKRWSKDKLSCHSFLSKGKISSRFFNLCWKGQLWDLSGFGQKNTLSKSTFFVQKFNFDFPRKLLIFLGEKLVKMLWFWTL